MIAMAGMFFAGGRTFTSLGVGAIMVVAVAMIGSVTVVPAVLAALGGKVDRGRIPFLHRIAARSDGDSRLWSAILGRRPEAPGAVGRAPPSLCSSRWRSPPSRCTPCSPARTTCRASSTVMKTYDRMEAAFPGGQIPAVVVVEGEDVTKPDVARGDRRDGAAGRRRPAT